MPQRNDRSRSTPTTSPKNNSWFRMQAGHQSDADIYIYDEIGFWGVTAKQFISDLNALGDITHINLHINSPGGDVFEGIAIFNALKTHGASITVYVDGVAASMASVIAMVANGAVIHIVPRLAGAKSGGVFQAVLGAALIAVAWWNPVGWLGAAAVSGIYAAGASMILGGVAQMLAPKARTPTATNTDNGRQNTYFSSLDNMVAQGNILPVLYGEMRVGSRVISQEVSTRDEGNDGKMVVIGRQVYNSRHM